MGDVRLLERNTRSVRLTKAGKEMLPAAQRIIRDMEKLVSDTKKVSSERESVVKITADTRPVAVLLPVFPPAIARLRTHPGTYVQVTMPFSDQTLEAETGRRKS